MTSYATVASIPRQSLPFGLFSVLTFPAEAGGRWEMGAQWETLPCAPAQVVTDPCVTGDEDPINLAFDAEGGISTSTPFTVIGEYKCSPVGNAIERGQQQALEQLFATEEFSAERELWAGSAGSEPSLKSDVTLVENPDTTEPLWEPKDSVARLERYLITSGYTSLGVIHMSRVLASYLVSTKALRIESGRLYTAMGTPVIAGSGYDGSGPDGEAGQWAYITPALRGFRSDVTMIPPSAGLDRSKNDLYAVAERTYLIGWDQCVDTGALEVQMPTGPTPPIPPEDDENGGN